MATLAELQATLTKYETARDAVLVSGQKYEIDGGMSYTRADLPVLEAQITRLENKIAMAQSSGRLKSASAVFGGRR
ncbi:MAG: hypothetical protein M0P69_03680 [Bacteroidales bacterium]|nr:hypothetical protein [Bacteroidales bacterium]